MAELNIPLSLIYDLAIIQSSEYYLDARYMAGYVDPLVKKRPNYRKSTYESEMKYWDSVNRTLIKMLENLEEN